MKRKITYLLLAAQLFALTFVAFFAVQSFQDAYAGTATFVVGLPAFLVQLILLAVVDILTKEFEPTSRRPLRFVSLFFTAVSLILVFIPAIGR